jgi:hypothetical protein
VIEGAGPEIGYYRLSADIIDVRGHYPRAFSREEP